MHSTIQFPHPPRLGVVAGLGARAAADLTAKLAAAARAAYGADASSPLASAAPFAAAGVAGSAGSDQSARKLHVFDAARALAADGAGAILLPCFLSHAFLDELQAELPVPVVSMMAALRRHLSGPGGARSGTVRVGILTSDDARAHALFERHLGDAWELVYPADGPQRAVMRAVYDAGGLKADGVQPGTLDVLAGACRDLLARGADVIVPGVGEIAMAAGALQARGLPVADVHALYARAAVAVAGAPARRAGPFRLGIVGGVGPAATVDFLAKIVRSTPAGRDRDHLKLVVDQNPQIPDRTAHLAGAGPDPTLALYAACLRLQEAGAGLIAIPCNTAHAFVARLQPRLAVPIVDMLAATADRACALLPAGAAIGLLATDGTVGSRLYDEAFAATGLRLVTPDAAHQRLVMAAIYGSDGIKAGRTEGACRDRLLAVLRHLAGRGARAVVLGCTELPLVLRGADVDVDGLRLRLLDPTDILAQACVARATAHAAAAPTPAAQAAE